MDQTRAGAWAGILSGVGLAVEAAFFMASGWSAEAFASFDGAATVMAEGGHFLRIAVVSGVFNLALLTLFVAALASYIDRESPALGGAVLYLGLVGIAIHALVPIGFYYAVPAFMDLAGSAEADASWIAFRLMLDTAQGAGIFFMGLFMVAAGVAAFSYGRLPTALGIVAALAGVASILGALAAGTLWAPFAGSLMMMSITLSIVFRIWGGIVLRQLSNAGLGARVRTSNS